MKIKQYFLWLSLCFIALISTVYFVLEKSDGSQYRVVYLLPQIECTNEQSAHKNCEEIKNPNKSIASIEVPRQFGKNRNPYPDRLEGNLLIFKEKVIVEGDPLYSKYEKEAIQNIQEFDVAKPLYISYLISGWVKGKIMSRVQMLGINNAKVVPWEYIERPTSFTKFKLFDRAACVPEKKQQHQTLDRNICGPHDQFYVSKNSDDLVIACRATSLQVKSELESIEFCTLNASIRLTNFEGEEYGIGYNHYINQSWLKDERAAYVNAIISNWFLQMKKMPRVSK